MLGYRSAATLAAAIAAVQPASAEQILIERAAPASRVVMVNAADLADPAAAKLLQRKLRLAAKAVCAVQYPAEDNYLFSRACTADSLNAAIEKTQQLRASLASRPAGSKLAIAVSAK